MSPKKTGSTANSPTIITITLPDNGSLERTGTLLIQRGDLATLRQFTYSNLDGISTAIQDAAAHLIMVESNPPQISNKPSDTSSAVENNRTDVPKVEDTNEPSIEVDQPESVSTAVNIPVEQSMPVNLPLF